MVAPLPVFIASVAGLLLVLWKNPNLKTGVGTGVGVAFYNAYLWDSLPGPPPDPITLEWWISAIISAFFVILVVGTVVRSFTG